MSSTSTVAITNKILNLLHSYTETFIFFGQIKINFNEIQNLLKNFYADSLRKCKSASKIKEDCELHQRTNIFLLFSQY